jgi:hypothetical protein
MNSRIPRSLAAAVVLLLPALSCHNDRNYVYWSFRANCHVTVKDGQNSTPLAGQVVEFRTWKTDNWGERVVRTGKEGADTTDARGDASLDFVYSILYLENWMAPQKVPSEDVVVAAGLEYGGRTYADTSGHDTANGRNETTIPIDLAIEVTAVDRAPPPGRERVLPARTAGEWRDLLSGR